MPNFVVAWWKNYDGHGHVVVVVPGEEEYSGTWGEYVPVVMDTGDGKRYEKVKISVGLSGDKKNDVVFFKYIWL